MLIMKENITMEELVNLCKQYGIIFQGSEIYGGLANTWDFGPVGAELKNNIKKAWKQKFIQEDVNNVGLDSAILMNPKVWEASGHISTFSDPLIDCKNCKTRYRADKLVEDDGVEDAGGMSNEDLIKYINEHNIVCPKCGKLDYTDIRQFNLMFKTFQGVTEDSKSTIYLRPETAQGIFADYQNIQRSMRLKLPFGVGQVGKSFRNEITPGNFIFRVREFEQMELEFFCKPGTELDWFKHYKEYCKNFLLLLGVKEENLRLRDHSKEELSFYSNATTDIEYKFPFGWGELWGIASRTNYDLSQHQKTSGVSMEYLDPETNEKYIPYVIEPSVGVERLVLMILCNSYEKELLENGDTREVMKFHPFLAPYKVAVLPLVKKYHKEKASEVYKAFAKNFMTTYDETGSIGKRYRRQDVIGTPFCITVDEDTIENETVTIRDRDTMKQITLPIEEAVKYVEERVKF
jgi:glycyl-tRNA synthetase